MAAATRAAGGAFIVTVGNDRRTLLRSFRLGNRWVFGPYFGAAVEFHAGTKHDQRVGTRARSSTPDLFSSRPAREACSQPSESIESPSAASRHILPADLPNAI